MPTYSSGGVPGSLKNQMKTGKVKCFYCGAVATTGDHVFPRSRGGKGGWINIVPACKPCNAGKDNLTPDEWKELRFKLLVEWLGPAAAVFSLIGLIRQCGFYGESHDTGVV